MSAEYAEHIGAANAPSVIKTKTNFIFVPPAGETYAIRESSSMSSQHTLPEAANFFTA